nr:MAG TPA: hypothetical protein [Caudoviricetes sp.]
MPSKARWMLRRYSRRQPLRHGFAVPPPLTQGRQAR